jgi:hypothetical protein
LATLSQYVSGSMPSCNPAAVSSRSLAQLTRAWFPEPNHTLGHVRYTYSNKLVPKSTAKWRCTDHLFRGCSERIGLPLLLPAQVVSSAPDKCNKTDPEFQRLTGQSQVLHRLCRSDWNACPRRGVVYMQGTAKEAPCEHFKGSAGGRVPDILVSTVSSIQDNKRKGSAERRSRERLGCASDGFDCAVKRAGDPASAPQDPSPRPSYCSSPAFATRYTKHQRDGENLRPASAGAARRLDIDIKYSDTSCAETYTRRDFDFTHCWPPTGAWLADTCTTRDTCFAGLKPAGTGGC